MDVDGLEKRLVNLGISKPVKRSARKWKRKRKVPKRSPWIPKVVIPMRKVFIQQSNPSYVSRGFPKLQLCYNDHPTLEYFLRLGELTVTVNNEGSRLVIIRDSDSIRVNKTKFEIMRYQHIMYRSPHEDFNYVIECGKQFAKIWYE